MPQDTRRSRMRRTPKGKQLMLTPRDMAIFRALRQYRYLRSTYLHAFAGGASETRFKERLGDLFHEGYLDRPGAQWRFADSRHAPVVYELGRGARQTLAERGQDTGERRVLLSQGAHRQFAHSLMVCEAVASIELATRENPDLRFVPLPEILAKAPETTRSAAFPLRIPVGSSGGDYIVPDAIFGLEYRSKDRPSYRFFALEADRGTMPVARVAKHQTSLLGKVGCYRGALVRDVHRSYLGVPNLLVLILTTTPSRMNSALGAARNEPTVLFKAVATGELQRPACELLLEPWERGVRPAIHLNRA